MRKEREEQMALTAWEKKKKKEKAPAKSKEEELRERVRSQQLSTERLAALPSHVQRFLEQNRPASKPKAFRSKVLVHDQHASPFFLTQAPETANSSRKSFGQFLNSGLKVSSFLTSPRDSNKLETPKSINKSTRMPSPFSKMKRSLFE